MNTNMLNKLILALMFAACVATIVTIILNFSFFLPVFVLAVIAYFILTREKTTKNDRSREIRCRELR